jgi:uncharacterized protein (TIGR02452 family)
MARETVAILERGSYLTPSNRTVEISAAVKACCDDTRLFTHEETDRLNEELLERSSLPINTVIEVRNETTLAGISRLLAEGHGPVVALNFASAKNPGGGFLNGSQAQEESLARSSALHASLLTVPEFYNRHRASPSLLYSDAMILSPGCPIFRDDEGQLLNVTHVATFITSAAPNAGAAKSNRPQELSFIREVLRRRSEKVLTLAAFSECPTVVLGAWGCGVFRNDPAVVAAAFAAHLRGGAWTNRFMRVVFSVLDTSPNAEMFSAFQNAMTEHT